MRPACLLAASGAAIAATGSGMAVAQAQSDGFQLTYPPKQHETTAERIFLLGTAPPAGQVYVNGDPIERSQAGHFAPSFPLEPGVNRFELRYRDRTIQRQVTRLERGPKPPEGLGFVEGSLAPSRNIARLPDEPVCFSAAAPPGVEAQVQLAGREIPLYERSQAVELAPSHAVLTGQNAPERSQARRYRGCTTFAQAGRLGQPTFVLRQGGNRATQTAEGQVAILPPTQLDVVAVTAESGDTRTGPGDNYARQTPLPQGTQAQVTGTQGKWLRLGYGNWIREAEVERIGRGPTPETRIASIRSRQAQGATEFVFPLQVPVPVSVRQRDHSLTLTLHNTTARTDTIRIDSPILKRLDWEQLDGERVRYQLQFQGSQQWGYQLRYEGTHLVLRLQHPPERSGTDSSQPLAGVAILLDPGHGGEELGARGPNGRPEKAVNLNVSQRLRAALEQRGANVVMTRRRDRAVSLQARADRIAAAQPAIALSLHYNALPDGGKPAQTAGVGAFWYHPQAQGLAQFLHDWLVSEAGRPSYGVFWNNLALTRPSAAPTVLLELGFMTNPQEFEWATDPQQQQQLAQSLAEGIAAWFARQQR